VKHAQEILWQALSETSDYFSLLGGSGRYSGFHEYHIPALVFILALENTGLRRDRRSGLRELIPERMWTETDDLVDRIDTILKRLTTTDREALPGFVNYVKTRYRDSSPDDSDRWVRFVHAVEEMGWHK
jgi:hypothetical protein